MECCHGQRNDYSRASPALSSQGCFILFSHCFSKFHFRDIFPAQMTIDEKIKHLEFIQTVIGRMADQSFLLKGWAITISIGLFAFLKDISLTFHQVLLLNLPILIFWIMDSFYLSKERAFRSLYENRSASDHDFSLNIKPFCKGRNMWWRTFFSLTLIIFYGTLLGTMLVIYRIFE
jgi:hypothetical protein